MGNSRGGLKRPCNQPDELPPIPRGWTEKEWTVEGQLFRLTQPEVPDAFLEDPEVHKTFDRDELVPAYGLSYQLFDENRRPLAVPRVDQYQLIEVRHRMQERSA
jgi:hypothetical protein